MPNKTEAFTSSYDATMGAMSAFGTVVAWFALYVFCVALALAALCYALDVIDNTVKPWVRWLIWGEK